MHLNSTRETFFIYQSNSKQRKWVNLCGLAVCVYRKRRKSRMLFVISNWSTELMLVLTRIVIREMMLEWTLRMRIQRLRDYKKSNFCCNKCFYNTVKKYNLMRHWKESIHWKKDISKKIYKKDSILGKNSKKSWPTFKQASNHQEWNIQTWSKLYALGPSKSEAKIREGYFKALEILTR